VLYLFSSVEPLIEQCKPRIGIPFFAIPCGQLLQRRRSCNRKLDSVKAFALPQHACVHLHRGTWHWGPYPIGPEVHLANVQAKDVVGDNEVAHLERDLGVVIEVRA